MQPTDDSALLREYCENHSHDAFAELVTRHINLVYSVAFRHVGNPHRAEEITHAVFIILAKKASSLRHDKALSSWLFQATHLTANNFLRSETRRHHREQEAYMQSTLNQPNAEAWNEIAPLLDLAVARLGEKDRRAIVLRFYEGKNLREVGVALGANEEAAKKRIARALEKLRKYFSKSGVSSTTAIIAGAISANSVRAAPVGLAKSVSAVAAAKGAAASASTLTLIKGALKLMAWTKAKTAIAAGIIVLLAAGATTATVKEVHQYENSEWDIGRVDGTILRTAPHIVRIIPTKFPNRGGRAGNSTENLLGLGDPVEVLVGAAYGDYTGARTVFLTKLPPGKYDFIANLPSGSDVAFQREIEKQFGIVGRDATVETNVLFLQIKSPNAPGLRLTTNPNGSSSNGSWGEYHVVNERFFNVVSFLEFEFGVPVIDQTGLAKNYDIDLTWDYQNDPQHENLKQALVQQLGLEVVPGVAPVKMLFVEKAK